MRMRRADAHAAGTAPIRTSPAGFTVRNNAAARAPGRYFVVGLCRDPTATISRPDGGSDRLARTASMPDYSKITARGNLLPRALDHPVRDRADPRVRDHDVAPLHLHGDLDWAAWLRCFGQFTDGNPTWRTPRRGRAHAGLDQPWLRFERRARVLLCDLCSHRQSRDLGAAEDYLALFFIYLIIFVPFLLGGLGIGLALTRFVKSVNQLYFADLVGSAIGAGVAVLALRLFGNAATVVIAAAFGLLAAFCFSFPLPRRYFLLSVPGVLLAGWLVLGFTGIASQSASRPSTGAFRLHRAKTRPQPRCCFVAPRPRACWVSKVLSW